MGCCSKFPLRVLEALTSAAPGGPSTLRLPSGTFRRSLGGLLLQGVLAHFKQEPLFHPALKDLMGTEAGHQGQESTPPPTGLYPDDKLGGSDRPNIWSPAAAWVPLEDPQEFCGFQTAPLACPPLATLVLRLP